MLVTMEYNRAQAVMYAKRWALGRNPLFENYAGIGGDCTNFVSQSIYAGSCVMNYTETFGWYYVSPTDRAPAWTGVQFLYNFLTTNAGEGPYASETEAGEIGDAVQLANEEGVYYHTLLITGEDESGYLVSAHTNDALDRPLASYSYADSRILHIEGVRLRIPERYRPNCFRDFIAGRRI